jgi:hypothetical protein
MTDDSKVSPSAQSPAIALSLRIAGIVLTVVYLVSVVVLLVWAARLRFRLPEEPLIDPDIKGYLGPALVALSGKPFQHLIGRSFPYPAFVFFVLRIFGDFRAIPVIQHIIGLGAGALILLAWNAIRDLAPTGGLPKPLFRFMGFMPAYVFLGSATTISFEHQIRPEGIFPFLAVLNMWLSFRFLHARFVQPRPSYLWFGALNAFASFLLYMLKPSFGFATILTSLPVWICLILPSRPWRERGILAAAAILPAALLLFLPEHVMKRSDPFSAVFLPETLLSAHAVLVEQQLGEDLASNAPLPFPRPELQAAYDMLGAELAKAPQIVAEQEDTISSYKPDYLLLEYIMYGNSFCVNFPAQMHLSPEQFGHFCMTLYLRALLHHPGGMVAQAKGQLALFYAKKNPAYWFGRSLDISTVQYARVGHLMAFADQLGAGSPAVTRYIDAATRLAGEAVAIPQATRLIEWIRYFSTRYLDFLKIALVYSVVLLVIPPFRRHFLWLIVALGLVYCYNFGNSLTIAFVHSMEVNRYVRIQLIFTIFAQCLTLGLLVEAGVFILRLGFSKFLLPRLRPAAK